MGKRQRTKLGILFGGRSGEHEVSLTSAASVIGALDPDEFQITAIGITREGRIADVSEVRRMLPGHLHDRINPFARLDGPGSRISATSAISKGHRMADSSSPEIIFPLLHGPYGEDGTIQGLLELAGIAYVGCGVLASAAGMDKDVMKRLFLQDGLPVLPSIVVSSKDIRRRIKAVRRLSERELRYPMFSKPANLGSSIGVRKIHSRKELDDALLHSAQFDRKVLVEQGIEARELECAILGNEDAKASVVGEVIPSHEFYDYDAKYHDPTSRLEIPAKITEAQAEQVRRIALRAFRAIEGSGLARVDFFLERKTGKIWLNEINTMPGFTPISMYAKLWAASGVDFENLVRSLIRLGLRRHRERQAQKVFPGN